MLTVVRLLGFFILGSVLAENKMGLDTWQFWVVLTLTMGIYVIGTIEGAKKERGEK